MSLKPDNNKKKENKGEFAVINCVFLSTIFDFFQQNS